MGAVCGQFCSLLVCRGVPVEREKRITLAAVTVKSLQCKLRGRTLAALLGQGSPALQCRSRSVPAAFAHAYAALEVFHVGVEPGWCDEHLVQEHVPPDLEVTAPSPGHSRVRPSILLVMVLHRGNRRVWLV